MKLVTTPWITVELPWRLDWSLEHRKLSAQFVQSVNETNARWKTIFPTLAAHHIDVDGDTFTPIFALQDAYLWLLAHREAPDVHIWRAEALARVSEIPAALQALTIRLIDHRFAYVLQSRFVDSDPAVIEAQGRIKQLREREHLQQFCNHAACKIGVQIEVRSTDFTTKEQSTRILLIGDVTPTGLDDGCCSAGLKDDDVIIRYRDLSAMLVDHSNV